MLRKTKKTMKNRTLGGIEPLERREMLSATANLSRDGSILFLRGTPSNDVVQVRQVGSNLSIRSGGQTQTVPMGRLKAINADLGGGTDRLDITNVQAGRVSLATSMGSGLNEKVTISNSSFASIGIDAVQSGGTDVAIRRSQGRVTFNAGTDGWRDTLKIEESPWVESVNANMGGGNDIVTISKSKVGNAILRLDGGRDQISVLTSQIGNMSVNFGSGINEVGNFSGSSMKSVSIDAKQSLATNISFMICQSISTLNCALGNAGDRLHLERTAAVNLQADMGGGNDTLVLRGFTGSTLGASMGDGSDKVFVQSNCEVNNINVNMGGGSNETVSFEQARVVNFVIDAKATRGVTVNVNSAHVAGTFNLQCGSDNAKDTLLIKIGGTNIKNLVANMGGGDDRVTVGGRVNVKRANIKMGGGNDQFFCYSGARISGKVNGGGGTDRFSAPASVKLRGFERRV